MSEELDINSVKARIAEEAHQLHSRLIEISHTLHEHPETAFKEYSAMALLTKELAQQGFMIERGVAGLETAFVATYGAGQPSVAFLAEYDALPKIGHACGHNLIATWALGAGIALRRALPNVKGTIKVIGTPAEEDGGGKVIMADKGVFRGLMAAVMMHPRDTTYIDRGSLAVTPYTIEFFGKSAHASAAPERGINALDAVLQVFYSINALRQSLKSHTRIHGVITQGGDAPNVIPDYAAASFLVRAREQSYLEEVKQKFLHIVEAAALATGARSQVTEGISYQQRVCNRALVEVFRDNLTALNFKYEVPPPDLSVGSSDVGNVSQLVPTIHPYLQICEKGIGGHTLQFAEAAAAARAAKLTATGAIMLAWTVADVLLKPEVQHRLQKTFREQMGRDPQ
ncbi:MAG: M20 family metallopeptidase [Ktedonobacteraceae bacterium]